MCKSYRSPAQSKTISTTLQPKPSFQYINSSFCSQSFTISKTEFPFCLWSTTFYIYSFTFGSSLSSFCKTKKLSGDDDLLFVETVLLLDVHHPLFVKLKKQLDDDHLLFVKVKKQLEDDQQLSQKVKRQKVERTIYL